MKIVSLLCATFLWAAVDAKNNITAVPLMPPAVFAGTPEMVVVKQMSMDVLDHVEKNSNHLRGRELTGSAPVISNLAPADNHQVPTSSGSVVLSCTVIDDDFNMNKISVEVFNAGDDSVVGSYTWSIPNGVYGVGVSYTVSAAGGTSLKWRYTAEDASGNRVESTKRTVAFEAPAPPPPPAGCTELDKECPAAVPLIEGTQLTGAGFEAEVLRLTNEKRGQTVDCGEYGIKNPVPLANRNLVANTNLTCSARYHSKWMVQHHKFDHDSPNGCWGNTMAERIIFGGYKGSPTGENIAAGQSTPAEVVQGWIDSPGHCANIMNENYKNLGVGYWPGGPYGHYWTQNFGG